jgi:hypothetical protein
MPAKPLEDALHVVVGAAVLGINRVQVARNRLGDWLDDLAAQLDARSPGSTQRPASPKVNAPPSDVPTQ